MLSGAWSRAKQKEGAGLWAGLVSGPRLQHKEREMGVLCLGALHPSLFSKGKAEGWLGLGVFPFFSLLCCSHDVHMLLC